MLKKVFKQIVQIAIGTLDELFPRLVDPTVDGEPWQTDGSKEYCPRCGISAGAGAVTESGCWNCANSKFPWDRITRLSSYSTPVDDWIKQMKFKKSWRWGEWFGNSLAEHIGINLKEFGKESEGERIIVCPVPMHWFRWQKRGYNQAQIIATALAKKNNWKLKNLLYRTRYTRPQTAIAPSRRHSNVSKAFALRRFCGWKINIRPMDLSGCTIILVDDVKTSGATLKQCASVLKSAGAKRIEIAVAAVADPPEIKN